MEPVTETIELIRRLENIESARIISYVLADRLQGPQASIATDALSLFHRHLESIGSGQKIALFLYSIGGDTMVPWPLVNLIREYCDEFVTLVPHKAYSAATLICLGANEIVMTKMAQLSPVDPSVANAFNPPIPDKDAKGRIPISVEDVAAYFRLATERAGLDTPETRLGALQQLTGVVHPLALGNVERSHTLIRDLSRKLLELHMSSSEGTQDKRSINEIVDVLTEKLYSHQHMIPRKEAKGIIGLKVRYSTDEEEEAMMALYRVYQQELGIGEIMNPMLLLKDRTELPLAMKIAKIETTDTEDGYTLKGKIVRPGKPGQPAAVNIVEQGWAVVR